MAASEQTANVLTMPRQGFRLFWRWTSRRRGRPRFPVHLQQLIAEMASANRTRGEERIAAELWLKLAMSISPRTVRRYMKRPAPFDRGARTQMWSAFLRNHARELLAWDFFVTVTARFRLAYVFVVLDIGTRRIVHWNMTEHPTAEWTVQQFRAFVTGDEPYRFVIYDHDAIYSPAVDRALASMQLRVLTTPARTPQANAFCERLIGTGRRECLDFMIPLNERHLRRILAEWVPHYNRGRPHPSLGPGIPDRPSIVGVRSTGHRIPHGHRVAVTPILGGLHHEYRLEPIAA
jgi:putative transposase